MSVNPSAIVDAISTDLAAQGLGQATTSKYIEPTVFDLAVDLPRLAVWYMDTRFMALSTADAVNPALYSRIHVVTVGWYVFDTSVETHGFDDPTLYLALEAKQQSIVDRLGRYAAGVPTFGTNLTGELASAAIERLETAGMWRSVIQLTVEDDSEAP